MKGERRRLADQAEKIVQSIKIPSPPRILIQLEQETSSPEPDFRLICDLVQEDLTLTARLLKIANSPFFGLRSRVENLSTALSVLGLNNFKEVVLGALIRKVFSRYIPLKEMEIFHSHSLQAARSAKMIASYLSEKGHTETGPETAYLAGLFHDCGMPLLSERFPEYYNKIRNSAHLSKPLIDIEEGLFNTNHGLIGGFLAKAWELPEIVCDSVSGHHDINADFIKTVKLKHLTAIIILAEKIISKMYQEDSSFIQIYLQQMDYSEYQRILGILSLSVEEVSHLFEYMQNVNC